MNTRTKDIFDKIFKKVLTLSAKSVINMINGLFGTDHPTDSKVFYNWTESITHNNSRRLADTILTINGQSYHIEAQMDDDETIVMRVFEYGFGHAMRGSELHDDGRYEIWFPEAKIVYIYSGRNTPDECVLRLNFASQGYFDYRVSAFKLMDTSAEELNNRKMVILIPFHLLKLRNALQYSRTAAKVTDLKKLITDDILGSIDVNMELGNISAADALHLKSATRSLYDYIYSDFDDMEVIDDMDQSYMSDADIIIAKVERAEARLAELEKTLADQSTALADMNKELADRERELADRDKAIADRDKELADRDKELADKERELEALKAHLQKIQNASS